MLFSGLRSSFLINLLFVSTRFSLLQGLRRMLGLLVRRGSGLHGLILRLGLTVSFVLVSYLLCLLIGDIVSRLTLGIDVANKSWEGRKTQQLGCLLILFVIVASVLDLITLLVYKVGVVLEDRESFLGRLRQLYRLKLMVPSHPIIFHAKVLLETS